VVELLLHPAFIKGKEPELRPELQPELSLQGRILYVLRMEISVNLLLLKK